MKKHMCKIITLCILALTIVNVNAEVITRNNPGNKFNKNVFEELDGYPSDKVNISEPRNKFSVYVKYKDSDKTIDYTNQLKYTLKVADNRAMISLLDVSNLLKTPISWYPNTRTIIVGDVDKYLNQETKENTKLVYFMINKPIVQRDTEKVVLDVPAMIYGKESRTYIPIRKVSELWNYNVEFSKDLNAILLSEL